MKAVSSMYMWIFIVPVAAKLVSRTESIAHLRIFDYPVSVPLSLPFSWQVFYFSAVFFVFAKVIHFFRCPSLVRDYPTYAAFKSEGKPDWHLGDYSQEIGMDYEDFKEQLESNMLEYDRKIPVDEQYSQSLFWHMYWHANRERAIAFYIVLACYILGFTFIGYVLIENLLWVLENAATV